MKLGMLTFVLPLFLVSAAYAKPRGPAKSSSGARASEANGRSSARNVVQRESKIEFDERLVQGQTASGAIYLFQRGEAEFKSLVHVPESFRDRTLQPLQPDNESRPEKR